MIKPKAYGPITQFTMGREYEGQLIYSMACYYVDGLLIDSGPFHVASELAAVFADYPVKLIVNTHHHEDHIGNNVWFQRHQGVGPALAHELAVPLIEDPGRWASRIMPYCQVAWGEPPASKASIIGNEVESNNYRFAVINTPGHCPDHISLLEADQGWLFAGDLFLAEKVTTLRSDEDIKIMLQSLKKLLQYDFSMLFCASGRVVESSARPAIEAKIAFWEEREEQINRLHREGCSEEEILLQMYGRESALYALSEGDFGKIHLIRSFIKG